MEKKTPPTFHFKPLKRAQSQKNGKKNSFVQQIKWRAWGRYFLWGVVIPFSLFLLLLLSGILYIAYHPLTYEGIPQKAQNLLSFYFPNQKLKAQRFNLSWNIPTRSLVINLKNVSLHDEKLPDIQTQAGAFTLQFPLFSMVHLSFWPRTVKVEDINFDVWVDNKTDGPDFAQLLEGSIGVLGKIHNIAIDSANLTIHSKENPTRKIPTLLSFSKINKKIQGSILYQDKSKKGFQVAFHTKNQRNFFWTIAFQDFLLADFIKNADFILPPIPEEQSQTLKGIRLPLRGSIHAEQHLQKGLQSLKFEVQALEGAVFLPHENKSVNIQGLTLSGLATPQKLSLNEITMTYQGLKLKALGESIAQKNQYKGKIIIQVDTLKIEDLVNMWPSQGSQKAKNWIQARLQGGQIQGAHIELDHQCQLPLSEDFLDWKGLLNFSTHNFHNPQGNFSIHDMTVRYMEEMPVVEKVDAEGNFSNKLLKIRFKYGDSLGQIIKSGTLFIEGMDLEDQTMKIDLDLQGPVRSALEIAHHEPLRLLDGYDLPVERIDGQADTKLQLVFPLYEDMKRTDVHVQLTSHITGGIIPSTIMGEEAVFTDGDLRLEINNRGDEPKLVLSGRARLLDEPLEIQAVQNFPLPDGQWAASCERQLVIVAELSSKHFSRFVGLPKGTISGIVPIMLTRTNYGQRKEGFDTEVLIRCDFKPALVVLQDIGLRKPHDQNFVLQSRILMKNGQVISVPEIKSYENEQIDLNGEIFWNPSKNELQEGKIHFKFPNNDVSVLLRPGRQKKTILSQVHLKLLDLKAAWERVKSAQEKSKSQADGSYLLIDLKADRVMYGQKTLMRDLAGALGYHKSQIQEVNLMGRLVDEKQKTFKKFTISTQKTPKQDPVFVFVTEDLGLILSAIGYEKKVRSGELTIRASRKIGNESQFWKGEYTVQNVILEEAPALLKLLNVVSPMIVTEVFKKEQGLKFDRLEGRFRYDNQGINLYKGQAVSPSVGLTFEGYIDTHEKQLDITGTVIPVYGLNAALGYIPIIGQILSGGPGEGLVAFNFTMQGSYDSPEVKSNPLSVLAPGFLRRLFRGTPSQQQKKIEEAQKDPSSMVKKKPDEQNKTLAEPGPVVLHEPDVPEVTEATGEN